MTTKKLLEQLKAGEYKEWAEMVAKDMELSSTDITAIVRDFLECREIEETDKKDTFNDIKPELDNCNTCGRLTPYYIIKGRKRIYYCDNCEN